MEKYVNADKHDGEKTFPVHHAGTSNCGSFAVGHDLHWIQVLRLASRGTPVAIHNLRLVDLVTVELDVATVVAGRLETLVRRNHDAVQVHATWAGYPKAVLVPGASLLLIGPASGAAAFSVTDQALDPCTPKHEGGVR